MPGAVQRACRGLELLRYAVARALVQDPALQIAGPRSSGPPGATGVVPTWLYSEAAETTGPPTTGGVPTGLGDGDQAASSEASLAERTRLIALVDLARAGDAEAFGMLFDHYHDSVYRFLYYRTHAVQLAEDLTSETFVRALRNMANFRWQGKDFGAWLMTIARNLVADHYKASRTRLELTTEDMGAHDAPTEGPEAQVLDTLTQEVVLRALTELPREQKDCLVMRFLQSLSIAETAAAMDRSEGAVKQLQLRAVRNLAKLVPEDLR